MLLWIGGGIVGVVIVVFLLGVLASETVDKKHLAAAEGNYFIRIAAVIILEPLLENMQRPGDDPEDADKIAPERIFPTTMLAGQKVFGEAFDAKEVKEAVDVLKRREPDYAAKLPEYYLYKLAAEHCSEAAKDDILLAALTAMQLNIQHPVEHLLPINRIAKDLYGDELLAQQKLIGIGSNANLIEQSIALCNQIVDDLSPADGGGPEDGEAA